MPVDSDCPKGSNTEDHERSKASRKVSRYLLQPSPSGLATVREFMRTMLRPFPVASDHIHDIVSATHEACKNALVHNPEIQEPVDVTCEVLDDSVVVEVSDGGGGFDPSILPPSPPPADADEGRGIFIMRALMDRVDTDTGKQGTRVRMLKKYR